MDPEAMELSLKASLGLLWALPGSNVTLGGRTKRRPGVLTSTLAVKEVDEGGPRAHEVEHVIPWAGDWVAVPRHKPERDRYAPESRESGKRVFRAGKLN